MSKMAFQAPLVPDEPHRLDFFPAKNVEVPLVARNNIERSLPVQNMQDKAAEVLKLKQTGRHEPSDRIESIQIAGANLLLEAQQQGQAIPPQFSLPYHNPFDFNSYPITNPPIFDSTMTLPYTSSDGVVRRRRLSISNGQIGQIINHEAFMENRNDLSEARNANNGHHRAGSTSLMDKSDLSDVPASAESDILAVNAAGVPPPNHQLIYNNEVIYNPNDGPIPGTAAWKRERLLERNRVAASKCRQRKKQAHQQLQESISNYEKLLEDSKKQIKQYELLMSHFKTVIKKSVDSKDTASLKQLLDLSLSDADALK